MKFNMNNAQYTEPPKTDWTNGSHKVCITGLNYRVTEQSGENYLNVEFSGLDGDMKGRKIWKSFYLWETTQNLKPDQWKKSVDLCRNLLIACKITDEIDLSNPTDLNKLQQRVIEIEVKTFKDKNTGDSKAYIHNFKLIQAATRAPGAQPAPAKPQANANAQNQAAPAPTGPIAPDPSLNDIPF